MTHTSLKIFYKSSASISTQLLAIAWADAIFVINGSSETPRSHRFRAAPCKYNDWAPPSPHRSPGSDMRLMPRHSHSSAKIIPQARTEFFPEIFSHAKNNFQNTFLEKISKNFPDPTSTDTGTPVPD